jgi:hypothetical protein
MATCRTEKIMATGKKVRSRRNFETGRKGGRSMVTGKVDTKWCFHFFAKYDYRFLLDGLSRLSQLLWLKR